MQPPMQHRCVSKAVEHQMQQHTSLQSDQCTTSKLLPLAKGAITPELQLQASKHPALSSPAQRTHTHADRRRANFT